MVLPSPVLRRTIFLWTLSRFMKVTVKISMGTSIKKLLQQHLAVTVWCKWHFIYAGNNMFRTFLLVTHAICSRPSKGASSSCGTPQSQITVVIIVMVLSTKLTLSLTPSTMRINVRQLRPWSAGFCQVCIVVNVWSTKNVQIWQWQVIKKLWRSLCSHTKIAVMMKEVVYMYFLDKSIMLNSTYVKRIIWSKYNEIGT